MPNVVFVPGLPGSELFERDSSRPGSLGKRWFVPRPFTKLVSPAGNLRAALCGPDDLALPSPDPVIAGEPVESVAFDLLPFSFDLAKQAASLYQILDERCGVSGAQLAKVGWDWRRPVTDFANADGASARLEAAIRSFPRSTVIVHSTGALVLRRLFDRILQAGPLAAGPFFARVERVVAFGAAWAGTPKALKGLVGQQGFGVTPAARTQEMLASSWAAHDLVPRAAASQVYDHAGVVLDPTSNAAASRIWVGPTGLAAKIGPRLDHSRSAAGNGVPAQTWSAPVELWNVCGWGEETDVAARINADGSVDFNATTPPSLLRAKSPWDGEAAWEGDGTVPLASAGWIRGGGAGAVRTIYVPIGGYADSTQSNRLHSSLWSNPAATAVLEHLLAGAPLPFVASAAVDWSDRVDPGVVEPRIRFAMQAPDGSALLGGALRVLNLTGAPDIPVRLDGRGLVKVRRSHLPLTAGGRFRRLETELRHASFPQPIFQRLFLEP